MGGMNWEIDIDILIKWITNENLLYSTGNPTQCSVVTKEEGNTKKRVCMYVSE